jgi:hypothetical protein
MRDWELGFPNLLLFMLIFINDAAISAHNSCVTAVWSSSEAEA